MQPSRQGDQMLTQHIFSDCHLPDIAPVDLSESMPLLLTLANAMDELGFVKKL
jgi:hypothetical protein